jgi:hypothetical protein
LKYCHVHAQEYSALTGCVDGEYSVQRFKSYSPKPMKVGSPLRKVASPNRCQRYGKDKAKCVADLACSYNKRYGCRMGYGRKDTSLKKLSLLEEIQKRRVD